MSKRNKVHSTVYTLAQGGSTKVVAIVDAKRDIKPHSVAQVIGYYSAFDVSHPQPLMVIMTTYHVKVIIFPFLEKGQPLVELKEFNF